MENGRSSKSMSENINILNYMQPVSNPKNKNEPPKPKILIEEEPSNPLITKTVSKQEKEKEAIGVGYEEISFKKTVKQ